MEEILKEIKALKIQHLVSNNLILENAKQSAIILTVLKDLLSELQKNQVKKEDGLRELIEKILVKLEELVNGSGQYH